MLNKSIRRSTLYRGWQCLVDFCFPPACPLCYQPCGGAAFCPQCSASFRPMPSCYCPRCGEPYFFDGSSSHLCGACLQSLPSHDAYYAAGLYAGGLEDAIKRFKFDGHIALDRGLARLVAKNVSFKKCADTVVPVPLHRQRLKERGYNQSQLLAQQLARLWRLPIDNTLLKRVRYTLPQQQLTAKERRKNLKQAFIAQGAVAGRRLILVDDVCTTGATLAACSEALKHAGAAHVLAVTVARAQRKYESPPS